MFAFPNNNSFQYMTRDLNTVKKQRYYFRFCPVSIQQPEFQLTVALDRLNSASRMDQRSQVRPLYEPGNIIPSVANLTEETSRVSIFEFPTILLIPEIC